MNFFSQSCLNRKAREDKVSLFSGEKKERQHFLWFHHDTLIREFSPIVVEDFLCPEDFFKHFQVEFKGTLVFGKERGDFTWKPRQPLVWCINEINLRWFSWGLCFSRHFHSLVRRFLYLVGWVLKLLQKEKTFFRKGDWVTPVKERDSYAKIDRPPMERSLENKWMRGQGQEGGCAVVRKGCGQLEGKNDATQMQVIGDAKSRASGKC